MEFTDLVKKRYSVRKMKDTQIKQEDLDKILEVARLSPTAKNKQRQRLLVVNTEESLTKVRECTSCHFDAPTIIIISYEKEYNELGEETVFSKKFGPIDIGIIVAHMTLEVTNLGLGSTIVGLFDKELLKEKLNIPDNYEPLLLLPIGYIDKEPSHLHNERLPIEALTKYNNY